MTNQVPIPKPEHFRYQEEDRVGVVQLSRPQRLNALTFDSYRELADFFAMLNDRKEVRAVVLTGEGKAFCSGGDVEEIIGPLLAMDAAELLAFTRLTGSLIQNIRLCRKPVIAVLNGTTCGAGAVMALAADFRVAAATAKIAFLFTKVGLSGADMGAAYLLPRVVGLAEATSLLLRGHFVSAGEAERIGLYHEVLAAEELLPRGLELAKELAAGPAMGVQMTKEMINRELSMTLEQAIEAEAQAQALCMQHPDFQEAYRAFVDKRAPDFSSSGEIP